MKKNNSKIFMSLAVFLLVPSLSIAKKPASEPKICPAELGTELPLPAGKEFEIETYHPETKSYKAFAVEFPDESTMDVTLEALAEASSKIKKDFNLILKNPQDIVGGKFKPEKDLKVLTEEELDARQGCVRK